MLRSVAVIAAAAIISALGVVIVASPAQAAGTVYYVSSSSGSDTNTGTSSSSPWKTLDSLNSRTFQPGDQLLLKRGDTWTGGGLVFTESGMAGAPITLSAYGSGSLPLISPGVLDSQGVKLDGVGYWRINNIAVSNAYEGIALSYSNVSNRQDVAIDSVQVSSLTPTFNSNYSLYNHTSAAIVVKTYDSAADGSKTNKANPPSRKTALTGFSVTNSTFSDVGAATWFGGLVTNSDGFQMSEQGSHQWIRNVTMDNLQVINGALWGFNVLFVNGGSFSNLRAFDSGGAVNNYGTAGLVVAYSRDVSFNLIHIRNVSRNAANDYDGAGFDFEGVGDNISLTNSTIDLTDGAGLMLFDNSGNGAMTDINVENTTISRWGRSPGSNPINAAGIRADQTGGSGQLAGLLLRNSYNQPTLGGTTSAYSMKDIAQATVTSTTVAAAPTSKTPTTAPAALSYGAPIGASRNDVTVQAGIKLTLSGSRTVTGLGRYATAGDYRPHSINLYRDSDKSVVARCVVYPTLTTDSDGLKYCTLSSGVNLAPGTYWLLSTEENGGDTFRDPTPITASSTGITVVGAGSAGSGAFNVWETGSRGYGPVGLK
ncbi:hypothetical protein BWO91_02015 [Plantibacter flavus]|uniref:hypothetical protein n=1 Tax=Plantibacter flavus TaxID=150123 RepID=UPI00099C783C|nr:hypothetical protein [Plantibacter flavus]AQX78936.1 hypothetical protein BWO91_02015 [Plantibacter flavus]